MKVTVGCPVRARDWILPRWFTHVELAADMAGVKTEYVFIGADDDPSHQAITDHCPSSFAYIDSQEAVLPENDHHWNPTGYRHMVSMRNFLLHAARRSQPDYFLSLDSDVLLHEDALFNLLETIQQGWDAVGGKCWMTDHTDACSYIQWINSHGQYRPDSTLVMPVDVIMAIKLMGPRALAVDYIFDQDGEDCGWSRMAQAQGLKLAWDGRVCSKHVMRRASLDRIDPRCGF